MLSKAIDKNDIPKYYIHEFEMWCHQEEWLEYEPVLNFIKRYYDILPKEMREEFNEGVFKVMDPGFAWKFAFHSDILRIQKEIKITARDWDKIKMVKNQETGIINVKPLIEKPEMHPLYKQNPLDDKGILNARNKEFTIARQVLAIHYLLEYSKIKNIDNSVKARFIQFLTGREPGASDIKNTTIYKKVRNPLSKDDKTLAKDLNYIRKHFEDLGLTEIAKMITNEISKNLE